MRRGATIALAAGLVLIAVLGTAGCTRVRMADVPRRGVAADTQSVPLGSATALKTSVRFGVGSLTLRASESTPAPALEATFTYSEPGWKPEIGYSVVATQGTLSVVQPQIESIKSIGEKENVWKLALAPGVPTDLTLDLGVGESDVDLSNIDVVSLVVVSGVGKATVDLSGPRTHDVKGSLQSGVGELDVVVPTAIGVRLVGGTGGIGELSAPGLTASDGGLVNAAWSKPGPKMDLTLSRGVGSIKIISAD